MKTKNIIISVLSVTTIAFFVLFMFSFTQKENVQYKAVVALDKIHIIYLNFENPVTVVVPGIAKEKVVVKSPEVTVKSLGDSRYSIPVMDPILSNKKVHLMVSILNAAGKEQLLQTLEYLVITAPEPQPYYINRTGGKIASEDMMLSDSIYVDIPGFYYEGFRYQVSKFMMIHTDTTGMAMTLPQESGWMFTPNQKLRLNTLNKGDRLFIDNIYATYTDPITKKSGIEIRIPKSMEFVIE